MLCCSKEIEEKKRKDQLDMGSLKGTVICFTPSLSDYQLLCPPEKVTGRRVAQCTIASRPLAIKEDVIPSELSVALIMMIRYTSLSWKVNTFLIADRSQSLRRYLPPLLPTQIYLHRRVPVWYNDDKNNLVSCDRVI